MTRSRVGFCQIAGAISASLLLPVATAQAATLVQTSNIDYQTLDLSTGPVTLSGFDSSLGTLDSVTIEYFFGVNMQQSLTNYSEVSSNISFRADYLGTFSFAGPSSIVGDYDINLQTGLMKFPGTAPGATIDIGPLQLSGSGTLSPVDISQFINNDFTYQLATLAGTSLGGNANTVGALHEGGGYVRVTYGYTSAIPEPATWAMLIVGFGLIGVSLRRQNGHSCTA